MINITKNYRNSLKNMNFIDLFAGIGGFRLALESYGANCVFSSEWEKNAQTVYERNFNEMPDGDITQINEKNIPKHDILCAGFPCQAFSISGKQKGFEDIRGTLFFDIARIARYHHPKVLILENVKNFATHDKGNTLKIIINTLNNLNYKVFYSVLNSSYFGVPEKRERIYIVAISENNKKNKYEFPRKTNNKICIKDIVLPDRETKHLIISRNDIRINRNISDIKDIYDDYPLRPIRIGIVNKGGQGERIYHEFGHAITLSAYGGGVGAKTGLYMINNKIRKLAPRECARIMGFPDSFVIDENSNQAYKQFGNSVVTNVLQYIILELIKQGVIGI